MLPDWFLRAIGIALIAFGMYDSKVYWRLILQNHPPGHSWFRVGVVLVLVFYFGAGAILLLYG